MRVQDVKKGCLTKQVHGQASGDSYVLVTVRDVVGARLNKIVSGPEKRSWSAVLEQSERSEQKQTEASILIYFGLKS